MIQKMNRLLSGGIVLEVAAQHHRRHPHRHLALLDQTTLTALAQ